MLHSEIVPNQYAECAERIAQSFDALEDVIVAAHVNLDGDALGSLVAASLLAKAKGKRVTIYTSSGIPDFLSHVHVPVPIIRTKAECAYEPKSAIFVDIGVLSRIGGEDTDFFATLPSINVDHHEGSGIGTLATWVEPKAAATCEMLAYVALAMDVPLRGELAESLALGVITDTGGFSHANTTPSVFELCAHLLREGCPLFSIREALESNMRHERMYLWAKSVPKVVFFKEGAVALCCVSLKDREEIGAKREDLEGFVEYLRRLKGVKIAVVLREEGATLCKYSLRSHPPLDVCAIAQQLNGGGHKNAAGGTLQLSLEDAKDTLVAHLSHVQF